MVVENPFARRDLLESPPPTPSPSNPSSTPQHTPRPSRSDPAPTSGKRDRSKSASDKVLSQDNLRHGLKHPGKCPKFVEPLPQTLAYPDAVQEPICPARHWSAPPLSLQGQSP